MPEFNEIQFDKVLSEGSAELGLILGEQERTQLLHYLQLFIKWNQAYNLSAIRDPEEMLYKHILDSLTIVPQLQAHSADKIIDVGTGGGLPGIPLAICCEDKRFTLLDSAGKKTRFLLQTLHTLGLKNVNVENRRVETFLPDERFDIVVSRAFASIDDMLSGCKHLLVDDGEFWAMKGVFPQDELSELGSCYKVDSCSSFQVPGDIGERCLVVICAV
ncbi:MAG: 16S rRNA (guanine(527)-N(7))-methyltransferase RsmG [Agarilytica sp.]